MGSESNFAPGGSGRSNPGNPASLGDFGTPDPGTPPSPGGGQWGESPGSGQQWGGQPWGGQPPSGSEPYQSAPTAHGDNPYGYPLGGTGSGGRPYEEVPPPGADPAWSGGYGDPGARRRRTVMGLLTAAGVAVLTGVVVLALWLTDRDRDAPISLPTPNSWSYGSNAGLDDLWDQCADGHMAACDELYLTAPAGTEYQRFGSTCGETSDASYGGCTESNQTDYGDDPHLDRLWDECGEGDMAACDDLYFESAYGSSYEEYGSTCGNTQSEQFGECTMVGADAYGSNAELDWLWDECAAGDLGVCDELWIRSPYGSEYEHFGSTCGETTEKRYGDCEGLGYTDYGDDAYRDELWDECELGNSRACDDLFEIAVEDSQYATHGDTCGGTVEANGVADCINPDHDAYGSDPYLDQLWDACEAGDRDACRDLHNSSGWGTEYSVFGQTCGGVYDEDDYMNACW